MSLVGWTSLAGAAILGAALACGVGGAGGCGGVDDLIVTSGGTSTTTTSTSSSSSSSSGTGGAGPVYEASGFSCTPKTRSLNADVVPITQSSCSKAAACHLAMQSGPGVVDQLVDRIAEECSDLRMMIKPGDPEASYVIHKLTNHNLCDPATTMPLNAGTLPASEIQIIYDWICQGAPSN